MSGAPIGLYSKNKLLAFAANISQGWYEQSNSLAYRDMAILTSVKSFVVQAKDSLYMM
jgi:hypothetical protein